MKPSSNRTPGKERKSGSGANKQFKLSRELGEAALVRVARVAEVEGVWMFQDGTFRDISRDQDRTRATFLARPPRKGPFILYHIHPSSESAPGGSLDVLQGYRVSYPSLEDFEMHRKVREKFADLVTTKVADGWGIWTFGLTPEGLREDVLRGLQEKTLYEWLKDGYIRTRIYSLRQTLDQRRAFHKLLAAHGLEVRYDSIHDLTGKVMPG